MNEKGNDKIHALLQYDTPTITNVVATYPKSEEFCMGLYSPWYTNWYTNDSVRCIFPEYGRRAGYAVTAVYGLPDKEFHRLNLGDILKALDQAPKPTVLVVQQKLPEEQKHKNGLSGGLMTKALSKVGCVGFVSDGPSRDLDEMRGMGVQYILSGLTVAHGELGVLAVNVPVSVAGMDVCPGEIIHMDESGACKFPADRLDEVLKKAEKLVADENRQFREIEKSQSVDEVIRALNLQKGGEAR